MIRSTSDKAAARRSSGDAGRGARRAATLLLPFCCAALLAHARAAERAIPPDLEAVAFLLLGQPDWATDPRLNCTDGPLAPFEPAGKQFRVHHPDFPGEPFQAPVGTKLGFPGHAAPLQFELQVKRRIPQQTRSVAPKLLPTLWNTLDERSVVQLELPVRSKGGGVDEDPGVALFNTPRYCDPTETDPPPYSDCTESPKLGLWLAARIRPNIGDDGCTVRPLLVRSTFPDELDQRKPVSHRIVGLWSDEELLPGDRVRFAYWGHLPRRSTELLRYEVPLKPRVRIRLDGSSGCPLANQRAQASPRCWEVLADDEVEMMRFDPGDPAFVHVVSPLDAPLPPSGDNVTVTLVAKDAYGNPSEIKGPLQVLAYNGGMGPGRSFCTTPTGPTGKGYRASCQGRIDTPGPVRFGVAGLPLGIVEVYNYTVVRRTPPYLRKVGDTHIHAGMLRGDPYTAGEPPEFLRSSAGGDHSADSAGIWATLEYLEKVSAYDFGSASYHAVPWAADSGGPGWQAPAGPLYDPFRVGPCAVDTANSIKTLGDWWTEAQRMSETYPASPGFFAFPAFEWHGGFDFLPGFDEEQPVSPANHKTPAHRVVMYRDHDGDLPLLPGTTPGRSPLCLVLYMQSLVREGAIDQDEVVIIPHMMRTEGNIDWELTYGDEDALAALLGSPDASVVERFHTVGEIYSARNELGPGISRLTAFEGLSATAPERHSFRFGWRELGAKIGVIASSDNHSRMPGVNDDQRADGGSYQSHEPTGTAIVLAAGTGRAPIFEALRSRRTYGTSGVRAWLDFRLKNERVEAQMGEHVCLTEDAVLHADLAVGMGLHKIEIWEGTPRSPAPYRALLTAHGAGQELWSSTLTLSAPGADQRKLYYFRAFLSPTPDPTDSPRESVWSSPIWVDWKTVCP